MSSARGVSEASGQPTGRLRVGVDVTSLLDAITGVGTFVREVVDGLAVRPDIDLHAFAVSWRGRDRLASVVPEGAHLHTRPMPARIARRAWARLDQPSARLLAGPLDVVHGPNYVVPPGGGAVEVVTVHDLTALHHPEMCTPDVLEWPGLLRRALARGAWVHTVSRFVADEVAEAFPEVGERLVVVPNGIRLPGPPGATTDATAGHDLAGGRRYVLALGTIEPRKDLVGLVRAFEAIAADDADLRLVVAGGDGLGADVVHAAAVGSPYANRIALLGRVGDAEREALLRGASAVAYPSVYEGFGLVPLEAMSVGVPVVATRTGAIPEVVGDAALLVEPGDVDALAAALCRVLDDAALVEVLAEAGAERLDAFTWERTVAGMADAYRAAAAGR